MKKSTITQLSKKGFGLLIISAIVGGTILSILFTNLEKLNTKIIESKTIHHSFLHVQTATHKLLTSPHLKESFKELNRFVTVFNKQLDMYDKNEKAKIKDDWSVCLDELAHINKILDSNYFNNQ